jgi:hypothetical protein
MKSPEKTIFEAILLIAALCALALLPLAAKAACGMQHQPPAFSEVDADADGFVSEEEFNTHRAERHAAMAEAGKPMKGMASAPAFADVDSDGDGKLTEAELTAAQQAHMQAMHESHQGMGDAKGGEMCGGTCPCMGKGAGMGEGMQHGKHQHMQGGMTMPSFGDLDLDGDGCINAEEFAKHQAEMHM